MNKKSFKFDLIQYNLKYSVNFCAMVDDSLAKELTTDILKHLSLDKCSCDNLDFNMFINDKKNQQKYNFDKYSFNVQYIGEWVEDGDLKNNGLIEEYPCMSEIKELHKNVGDIDYYFSICNVSFWCDFFETDARENCLCILKREKLKDVYRYDVIYQGVTFSETEKEFYASLSSFSFKTNNVNMIEELKTTEKIVLKDDFDKYEENFLPMTVDGYKHVISYDKYFKILQNVENLETLEELIKNINK